MWCGIAPNPAGSAPDARRWWTEPSWGTGPAELPPFRGAGTGPWAAPPAPPRSVGPVRAPPPVSAGRSWSRVLPCLCSSLRTRPYPARLGPARPGPAQPGPAQPNAVQGRAGLFGDLSIGIHPVASRLYSWVVEHTSENLAGED
nr:neural Wiskott-Aldrich syndrome protein-like [Anser cygnoides]